LALALIVAGIVTVQCGQHREMAAWLHQRRR
jgi:hypothetical protein